MSKPVLIFGASLLGKAALEIFLSNNVVVYGFLDENESLKGTEIDEVTVLGSPDEEKLLSILDKKCDAFLSYDDNRLKKSFVKLLAENHKTVPVNAIHRNVSLAKTAILHHGTFIDAGSTIGAMANIGNHCILNAGVLVGHGAQIGDYTQIGAGSIINTGVVIEEGAFIGAGSVIVSGIKVGKNARIGAGSVVIQDVQPKETVFGNPAKPLKQT
jgi:sugar O-acyltransferase (sialic acid O-acetyltransferase NeuD family)